MLLVQTFKFGVSIEIDETFDDSLLDAIDAAIEKAKGCRYIL